MFVHCWASPLELGVLMLIICYASAAFECMEVPLEAIPYCSGEIPYLVSSAINVTTRDAQARLLYEADLAVWKQDRDVSCAAQSVSNGRHNSICNNCLAIRRRYHCVSLLPKCLADKEEVGICEGLCNELDRRCDNKPSPACDEPPKRDCSPAAALAPSRSLPVLVTLAASLIMWAGC